MNWWRAGRDAERAEGQVVSSEFISICVPFGSALVNQAPALAGSWPYGL